MIDLDMIRDTYANMYDEELILLAREDRSGLTSEAMALLTKEFEKRKLDMSVLADPAQPPTRKEEKTGQGSYQTVTNADTAMLGLTYQEMMYPADPAKEKNDESGTLPGNITEENLQLLVKQCESSMMKNGIVFIIGIAITLFTFLLVADSGGSYIVAWGAILFGGIGFFRALHTRNNYATALKDIIEGKQGESNENSQVDSSFQGNNT